MGYISTFRWRWVSTRISFGLFSLVLKNWSTFFFYADFTILTTKLTVLGLWIENNSNCLKKHDISNTVPILVIIESYKSTEMVNYKIPSEIFLLTDDEISSHFQNVEIFETVKIDPYWHRANKIINKNTMCKYPMLWPILQQ